MLKQKLVDEIRGFRIIDWDDDILVVRDGQFVGSKPYQGGRHLDVMTANVVRSFTIHQFAVQVDDDVHQTLAVIDEDGEVAPKYTDIPWPFKRWTRAGGEILPPSRSAMCSSRRAIRLVIRRSS